MKSYAIVGYTDPYHGSRAFGYTRFNSSNYAKVLRRGLSLREAQSVLLGMFSEDAGRYVANWGAATRLQSVPGLEAYPTHKDGTRAYTEDVFTYRIEEEND